MYGCASINSTNYLLRIDALYKVTDQNLLFKIALQDENLEVKLAAFNKITDQNLINRLAIESDNSEMRQMAVDIIKDQNILFEVALNDINNEVKKAAFYKITDQNLIDRLAVECDNSELRQMAVHKIVDQNLLYDIVMDIHGESKLIRIFAKKYLSSPKSSEVISPKRSDYDIYGTDGTDDDIYVTDDDYYVTDDERKVREEALNRITDQILINKLAIDIKGSFVEIIVKKVRDQNILFDIAIDKNRPEVLRIAAINTITDQNMLYSITKDICSIGRYDLNSKDIDSDIKVNALNRLLPSQLVNFVSEKMFLGPKLYAIDLLDDQILLMNIAENNRSLNVRRAAFFKLNDNSLDIISRSAKEPSIILAAKIRLGLITWDKAFSIKNYLLEKLNPIIGAIAMIDNPIPTSADVISACRNCIRLGDDSRIPELINLLNRFGDESLALDYMNCGNDELESAGSQWGSAHGYKVKKSYGSPRVKWGQGK